MPHAGSFWVTAAKVSLALSYQKEWSMATALLNCGWTAWLQETGKFTVPSFAGSPAGCSCSCWAIAGATKVAQTAISTTEINVIRFILASLVRVDRPGPSCSTVTLHDIEDGILAEPKPMTNFPIRLRARGKRRISVSRTEEVQSPRETPSSIRKIFAGSWSA